MYMHIYMYVYTHAYLLENESVHIYICVTGLTGQMHTAFKSYVSLHGYVCVCMYTFAMYWHFIEHVDICSSTHSHETYSRM